MIRQVFLLLGLSMRGMFGWNEFIHTREKKIRFRFLGLGLAWLILFGTMVFYVWLLADGLVKIGMEKLIPTILYLLVSMVILFFTIFKAGSVIFDVRTYEMLTALPVTRTAVIVSRFLTMYVTDLLLSLSVLLPGLVIYGVAVRPGAAFYVFGFAGTVLLPLFPMVLATAAGAVVTAVGARMRHKSIVMTVLTFVVVLISLGVSNRMNRLEDLEVTLRMLMDAAELVNAWIGRLYPIAVWFGECTVSGSVHHFLLLAAVSVVPFALLTAVAAHWFGSICRALAVTSAKHNYKMQELKASSVRRALFGRELKRYFASSVYVTNTMVGYFMMPLAAGTLLFVGERRLELLFEIDDVISRAWPLVLGMVGAIMPVTSCSISMEGKQWWILRTLPVTAKEIFDGKLLLNFAVALPFYLLAVVLSLLAMRPSGLAAMWVIVIPALYIVFTAVAGITGNLIFPVFNWENETRIVKQSASCFVAMVVGLLSVLPPFLCMIFLRSVSADVILAVTSAVLLVLTAVLYLHNKNTDLLKIG